MKTLYSILILLITSSLLAQPTISNAVIPNIGASSTYRLFDAEITFPGDSGANVTWDFSDLVNNGSGIFDYKDPSTLPNSSQYPSANLGLDQNGDPQAYLISDNQQYSTLGLQIAGISENYNNNPKELIRFPISYSIQFLDSFAGTVNAGAATVNRTGNIEITGDGYGTLILPYATFTNVLRVRTVSVYSDELLSNVVNSGIDTIYTWYKEGIKDNLISWSRINSTLAGDIYYGAFLDTMFVGINEASRKFFDIKISPNPATSIVHISYQSSSLENIHAEILDASGKSVKQFILEGSPGINTKTITVESLKSGFYSIILKYNDGMLSRKLIIQ